MYLLKLLFLLFSIFRAIGKIFFTVGYSYSTSSYLFDFLYDFLRTKDHFYSGLLISFYYTFVGLLMLTSINFTDKLESWLLPFDRLSSYRDDSFLIEALLERRFLLNSIEFLSSFILISFIYSYLVFFGLASKLLAEDILDLYLELILLLSMKLFYNYYRLYLFAFTYLFILEYMSSSAYLFSGLTIVEILITSN